MDRRSSHPLTEFYVLLNAIFAARGIFEPEKDCISKVQGGAYMGTRNITVTGKTCQSWALNSPHRVDADINDHSFPDGSKKAARNYCRNPRPAYYTNVWCYTEDLVVEWEFCDICPDSFEGYSGCSLPDKGVGYKGYMARTRSAMECQPWVNHPNEQFTFSEGSAKEARNYCRNPDPETHEAPWCYISGVPDKSWDYCDICKPFLGRVIQKPGAYTGEYQELPIAKGRLTCIQWCIVMEVCAGIVLDKTTYNCVYFRRHTTKSSGDTNLEQFLVKRVCIAIKGVKKTHFVSYRHLRISDTSKKDVELNIMSEERCQEKCIARSDCYMYEWVSLGSRCDVVFDNPAAVALVFDEGGNESLSEGFPIICDPFVEPYKAVQAAPDVIEQSPGVRISALEKSKEEETGGSTGVILIVAVLAIVALAGVGFAYYKFVYLKGKEKEKKESKYEELKKSKDKKKAKSKHKSKSKDKTESKKEGSDGKRKKSKSKKKSKK